MTWIGYTFWGVCALAVIVAFAMEKRFGTKAPDDDPNVTMNQEITRVTHNNDRPRI